MALSLLTGACAGLAHAGDYRSVAAFDGGQVTAMCRSGGKVFAAVLKGGIFYSEDEGATWKKTAGDPTAGLDLPLMAATATSIFASSHTALYRYAIASGEWSEIRQKLEPGKLNNMYLRALAVDQGRIAALGYYATYVSGDDGNTWLRNDILLKSSDDWIVGLVPRGPRLYATTLDSLFRSDNNGLTWSKVAGFPQRTTFATLVGGETGLWSATSHGLFACPWSGLDAGAAAWKPRPARGIPANRMDLGALLERQGNVWVAGPGALFLSRNGGDDFTLLPAPAGRDPGSLSALVEQGTGVLAGSENVSVVAAGEDGFTRASGSGIRCRSVTALATHHGRSFALVGGLGLQVSDDQGRTWSPRPGLATGLSDGKFCVLGDRLHLLVANTILRYDEGAGQFRLLANVPASSPVNAALWRGGRLYAGTAGDGIHASDDSGKTWQRPAATGYRNLEGLSVASLATTAGSLFATAGGRYANSLYKWVPDSSTWRIMNAPGACGKEINVVRAHGDSLLTGTLNDVCLSLDDGASWKSLWKFPDSSAFIHHLSGEGRFLTALSGIGAAWSDDMGATWASLPSPGAKVTSVVRPTGDRLLVGTNGASLWEYYPTGAPPIAIRAVRGAKPAFFPLPPGFPFDILGRWR